MSMPPKQSLPLSGEQSIVCYFLFYNSTQATRPATYPSIYPSIYDNNFKRPQPTLKVSLYQKAIYGRNRQVRNTVTTATTKYNQY